MPKSEVFNEDCMVGMARYPDKHFDLILTDPPYLYLDHKLDRDFDEYVFFNECNRLLKQDGFIVLFGRGTSFYRWNTILSDLGFKFREEIVWNKVESSSIVMPINRVHETASIHTKSDGRIKSVKIPYVQMRTFDTERIVVDINRLKTALNNTDLLDDILSFVNSGKINYKYETDTELTHANTLKKPRSVVSAAKSIKEGMKERTIISQTVERYNRIHPTQKPSELFKRIIKLVACKGCKVIDPFLGSGSSRIAAYDMGFDFTGFEIDKDYFDASEKRFKQHIAQLKIF